MTFSILNKRAVRLVLCGFVLACVTSLHAQQQRVVGRTIYHKDKSRTESVNNPETREMTESTYSPEDVLTVKKVFLLNEKGEPLQGNVYDGRGNLVAVVKCSYDEVGRRKEDRLMNLQGETFQIVVHEYGTDGKALQPKVVNLNVANTPSMKPAAIDFTQQTTPPGAAPAQPATTSSSDRFAPQMVPSSGMGTAPVTAPEPEKPKPNFFKRLFQKKEK